MATIFNTIEKPAGGAAQDDFDVTVTLSWDPEEGAIARDAEEQVTLKGVYKTQTDDEGYWSVSVVPNFDILPEGSVYKITETERGSTDVVNLYYISIDAPSSPMVYWVGDILVSTPAWEES